MSHPIRSRQGYHSACTARHLQQRFTITMLLLLSLSASASPAEQPTPSGLLTESEQISALAQSRTWLNLLHYRRDIFSSRVRSQADDAAFFYAANGSTDPEAELRAFINVLQQPPQNEPHPACRFPARLEWLRTNLPDATPESVPACPELQEWLSQLNAEHITLVFAASYLNSPSSMFGHTFLRVDPKGMQADNLLLANTISYAADAGEHDNELMFAYRGIFGGYPGITTVEPYYQKLKLYTDIENRDLWEYQLDLSPQEVNRLLLHTWEIKDIRFDYFFFDENCAYRLFTLIDVARPGLEITRSLPTLRAIPSDTARIIVDRDIVADIKYRPATSTIIHYQLDQLTDPQRDAVENYLEMNFDLNDLSDADKAEALETAFELQQFRTIDESLPREQSAPVSFALLKQRGSISLQTEPRLPPPPPVRDDEGHDTLRLGVFGGRLNERNYLTAEWRPAYHDLDDPLPGYRQGAHLQFFNTQVRFYTDDDEVQLEQFKFVEIISLTPRDRFFHPWSWKAGFGAHRSWTGEHSDGSLRPLTPYVDGMIGSTYAFGPLLLTGAFTASAEISSHLPDGAMIEPGVALKANWQSETLRFGLNLEQRADTIGQNEERRLAEARLSYSLTDAHSIQLRVAHEHSAGDGMMDIGLGWYGYF